MKSLYDRFIILGPGCVFQTHNGRHRTLVNARPNESRDLALPLPLPLCHARMPPRIFARTLAEPANQTMPKLGTISSHLFSFIVSYVLGWSLGSVLETPLPSLGSNLSVKLVCICCYLKWSCHQTTVFAILNCQWLNLENKREGNKHWSNWQVLYIYEKFLSVEA